MFLLRASSLPWTAYLLFSATIIARYLLITTSLARPNKDLINQKVTLHSSNILQASVSLICCSM